MPKGKPKAEPENPVAAWFNNVTASVEQKITQTHDDVIESTATKVLSSLGPELFRSIEDPYCPQPLKGFFRRTYDKIWGEIESELRLEVLRSYAKNKLYYDARYQRLDHWPDKPALFKCCDARYTCCGAVSRFLRVLRARFLYADQPADGSTWSVLLDPLGLLIFLLKLHITTSVATFALLFLLMDRRDEAQLVRFILKFKSVMFLTAGIMPAAYLGVRTHSCLAAIEAGTPQLCIEQAASSSDYFQLSLYSELVRLVLIWAAFGLLASGYAVGGDEEIAALENQRLLNASYVTDAQRLLDAARDAAAPSEAMQYADEIERAELARSTAAANADAGSDAHVEADGPGAGPGAAALVLPAAGGVSSSSSSAKVAPLSLDDPHARAEAGGGTPAAGADGIGVASPRVLDPAELHRQLEDERAQVGATRRVGGALPYFLAYDVLILLTLILAWLVMYVWPRSCGGHTMPFTLDVASFRDGFSRLFALATSSDTASAITSSAAANVEDASGNMATDAAFQWIGFQGCAPLDTESPLFWSSLYNLKMCYGLLCFPFLAFELPVIGETLHKCRDTAYDQTGQLVSRLTKSEVATLYDRRLAKSRAGGRDLEA